MNRAQVVQAIAACDALATELRRALRADAAAEYAEQGCAPTWRMPGYTVTTAVTHGAPRVADEAALLAYVADRYPTEVETIRRVRPAFLVRLLDEVTGRGEPPCDSDGTVIPGLEWVPGGEFRSVSIRPAPGTVAELRRVAREIAEGRAPLALPDGGESS